MSYLTKYNRMNYYNRFTQWQQNALSEPSMSDKETTCLNCGHTFTGNYCPACGQSASVARSTWQNIMRNTMEVWGMGSRSLPRNIVHLLLRPGHLIADYLQGRRQAYFPPVKMLFLLAALYMLVKHWTGQDANVDLKKIHMEGLRTAASMLQYFFKNYYAVFELLVACVAAVSLRLFFGNSPRMGRINLCECVFIQVWVANMQLILEIALLPIRPYIIGAVVYAITYTYNYIAFKQLFGYSWKSTLWRLVLLTTLTAIIALTILFIVLLVFCIPDFLE